MTTHITKSLSTKKQTGQSMTQYLILTFMLAVGSLVTIGNASQAGRLQVAAVSHEIAGNHVKAKKATKEAQKQAGYASASASLPSKMGSSDSSQNPIKNPTGPNTTPATTSVDPSKPTNNPVLNPTNGGAPTTPTDTEPTTPDDSDTDPTTLDNDPSEPTTAKCTNPTPEEDDGTAGGGSKEEDKGFWGSLWSEVKNGLTAGYEFVKGFWEGMKNQVADLGELLSDPIGTAKGLIELGKQFVDDAEGTTKMIVDALGEEFNTLVKCGSFDKGRIIGENVSPAFMIKLASKMAKFGNLAKALKQTKKDFGCASFAAGTPIWTPDGKVNIESLIKGNVVLSRNEKSYEDQAQQILTTFGRTAPFYYQLTTEFGTIKVTEEHPVWKQGRGWTEAQYLKVDDVVASADGDILILDNQKVEEPLQVYNFSVENTPSYFAGDSKLWVHNAAKKTICDPTKLVPEKIKFSDLGTLIGEGGVKKVYDWKEGLVVGVVKPDRNPQWLVNEIRALKELQEAGLPVVKAHGLTKVDGKQAIVMTKLVDSVGSKDIKKVNGKLVKHPNFNSKTVADLKKIKQTLIFKKIRVDDLQFIIKKDGSVVIADPAGIRRKKVPSKKNIDTIDELIIAAGGTP
ncbi:MAG: hypothetical protein L3J51_03350 [Cocleimonas sp.]|nr:hypothetical protein [Cocleimonas sp.]